MKHALGLAGLLVVLTLSASADTYSVSSLALSSGSIKFNWTVTDNPGSSSIASQSVTSGSDDTHIPFVTVLTLPSTSSYLLSSASLTFSATSYSGAASSSVTSSSSVGAYISGFIPCQGWSQNVPCPIYSTYDSAAVASFGGASSAVLTGISDGLHSWTGSYSGGTLNLASLGFGTDLFSGGSLVLKGYRDVSAGLLSYSNTGFNARTTFSVSYNSSSQEFATLSFNQFNLGTGAVDPPLVPEPRYGAAILFGIGGVVWSFRRRIKPSGLQG